MEILLLGMSHKSAPIELRERAALASQDTAKMVAFVKERCRAQEVFYLSTCNRVEVLAIATTSELQMTELETLWGVSSYPPLYRYRGGEAVKHLFRVAASLDSLVIGEPQILGQVKEAYGQVLNAGGAGVLLNKLLHSSFRSAKLVRERTKIAQNPVSISHAAIDLAKRIFSKLTDKRVLLVGAGEMAVLAAQRIADSGVKEIFVANRTFASACALASSFQGKAIEFSALGEGLAAADIVITSTGASDYIISLEMVKKALEQRKKGSGSLFIIDIAMPRDVEPAIGNLDGVYLYNIDELQGVVDKNTAARKQEALAAEAIVEQETERFEEWLGSLELAPLIVALREKAQGIVASELAGAKSWLHSLSSEDQERVGYLLRATANKLLHSPSEKLKKAQAHDMARNYAAVLKDLFDL